MPPTGHPVRVDDDGQEAGRSGVVAGWRSRTCAPGLRRVWGVAYLLGYVGWSLVIRGWALRHGHESWTEWPWTYVVIAALMYWPVAILLWRALYPADPRPWPFGDWGDDRYR